MFECPVRIIKRGSFVTGKSLYNERIERIWSEFDACVVRHYKNILNFLVAEFFSEPLNEMHLFPLCYVYFLKFNKALMEFTPDKNFHPLSSAINQSLKQLWHPGITRFSIVDPTSPEILSNQKNYGIDGDSPFPDGESIWRHPITQLSPI